MHQTLISIGSKRYLGLKRVPGTGRWPFGDDHIQIASVAGLTQAAPVDRLTQTASEEGLTRAAFL
jgi:hypothetical protein